MKTESIRILLVDDEMDALDLMEGLLQNMVGVEVVGKVSNKFDAISSMLIHKPDVIFQDIQMRGENGLDMVDEYRNHSFAGKVVFVTAHMQYAIDAIKKAAFDYLLKPVDLDELRALVLRLLANSSSKDQAANQQNKKLKIPTRTGYLLIPQQEIVYCEADGNYTKIMKSNAEQFTTSIHLGKLEEDLDKQQLFRISRSVIMNVNYLVSVNKGKQECTLKVADQEIILHISSKRIAELETRI
jgi:DNA-binding LytR/AlgR family response regulator